MLWEFHPSEIACILVIGVLFYLSFNATVKANVKTCGIVASVIRGLLASLLLCYVFILLLIYASYHGLFWIAPWFVAIGSLIYVLYKYVKTTPQHKLVQHSSGVQYVLRLSLS
jgi:hypothetical protein